MMNQMKLQIQMQRYLTDGTRRTMVSSKRHWFQTHCVQKNVVAGSGNIQRYPIQISRGSGQHQRSRTLITKDPGNPELSQTLRTTFTNLNIEEFPTSRDWPLTFGP